MFGFISRSKVKKMENDANESRERIRILEETCELLTLNISNLQSAIMATSQTQEAVSYDVARIGELLTVLLEASEFGGSGDPGSGTLH